MLNVSDKDLKNEIRDMRERFPRLQESELTDFTERTHPITTKGPT